MTAGEMEGEEQEEISAKSPCPRVKLTGINITLREKTADTRKLRPVLVTALCVHTVCVWVCKKCTRDQRPLLE